MITKDDLKQEIELLDSSCLELVYKLLQQFPHQQPERADLLNCSRQIDYPNTENVEGHAFADIDDAASFGKQLRKSIWQRT
jgi:DNA polymerase III psi subunit